MGLSRILIGLGLLLCVAGVLVWLLERAGVRPGSLPGDLSFGRDNVRVYVPIATSIIFSLLLTLILWVVGSLRR